MKPQKSFIKRERWVGRIYYLRLLETKKLNVYTLLNQVACFSLLNQFLLPPHKTAMLQEVTMFTQGAFSKFISFLLSSIHQIIYLQIVSPDVTWHFDHHLNKKKPQHLGRQKSQESSPLCKCEGNRDTFSMETLWSAQSVNPKEHKYKHLLSIKEKSPMNERSTDNSSLTGKCEFSRARPQLELWRH